MKPYILFLALVGGMAANAQILEPGSYGAIARAEAFYAQDLMQGTLDQLIFAAPQTESMLHARALFAEGRYEAARAIFINYASENAAANDLPEALTGAADCLFAMQKYSEAAKEYALVPDGALSSADTGKLLYRRAICALCDNKTDDAKNLFTRAASYAATRSAAEYYLGVIAFDAKQWSDAEKHFSHTNKTRTPGRRAPYYLAQIDFARQQWTKAVAAARQVLNTATDDEKPEMLRVAGESLCRLGQNSEGIDYLRRYISVSKAPMPSALYLVGTEDYRNGDYKSAVDLLGQSVAKADDGPMKQSAYLYSGQALMHLGDNDAAILAFNKALAITDGDPSVEEAAFYNYAVARFNGATVPFSSAADTFEEFLRRYPTGPYSSRVAEYLAGGYLAERNYAGALERSQRVSNPSPKLLAVRQKALYGLGWTALQAHNYDSAAEHLADAANIKSDATIAAETALLQGIVESRRGNNSGAAAFFERYVRMAPANSPNAALGNYRLGYAYFADGRVSLAESAFRRALPALKNAERADVLNRLGDLRAAAADYDAAVDLYNQSINSWQATSDYPTLQLARVHGYKRDYNSKLAVLNDFRKRYANSALMPDALLESTQAHISLGQNDEAISIYRTLISSYSNTPQGRRAYLEMAMTLLDQGHRDDAINAYRTLISHYPTSEEATSAASLLRTLYAAEGRADDYFAFMKTVDSAPSIDAADTETLAYESAVNAYKKNNDTTQLQRFVDTYTTSSHRAEILAMLMNDAERHSNTSLAESYASILIEQYPDSRCSQGAMAIEARRLHDAGMIEESLNMWRTLADRASDNTTAARANLGAMRAARELGKIDIAAEMADKLLDGASTDIDGFSIAEVQYTKADALDSRDQTDEAIALWLEAAKDPSDEFGARSAFRAADALYDSGKTDKALATAREFTRAGSQHHYWLARTFILMSDIYRAQGKDFEAREYLQALRENYPGADTDIFVMIDERLSNEKQ